MTSAVASSEVKSWKVGDYCRAVYAEDGNEYEGKVTSSGESEGQTYYVVQVQQLFFNDYAATEATGVAGKLSFEKTS